MILRLLRAMIRRLPLRPRSTIVMIHRLPRPLPIVLNPGYLQTF